MSKTGYATFETTVDKTNHVLKTIEKEYGWPKERRQQSYDALRIVLHALRDRLTIQEASDFAASLPILIRGIYYDGWNPSKVPVKMDREEFLARIEQEFIFEVEGGMTELVKNVLCALRTFIPRGELEDIKTNMPKDLAAIIPDLDNC